jgi:hypothetical protein
MAAWHSPLKTHGFASQPHDWFTLFKFVFLYNMVLYTTPSLQLQTDTLIIGKCFKKFTDKFF